MPVTLVRQALEKGDIHPRYKTPDGAFEVIPGYAGHGYSKPSHYVLKQNGRTIAEPATLKEARVWIDDAVEV